jgi:hypothetical protein
VYIGQTGRSIETRHKQHDGHLQFYQPDKSALAEHSTEPGYRIKFHETKVLAKTSGWMDRLVKEATEIKLCPDNVNREEGFKLNYRMESKPRLIKALQHTYEYITKAQRRICKK